MGECGLGDFPPELLEEEGQGVQECFTYVAPPVQTQMGPLNKEPS